MGGGCAGGRGTAWCGWIGGGQDERERARTGENAAVLRAGHGDSLVAASAVWTCKRGNTIAGQRNRSRGFPNGKRIEILTGAVRSHRPPPYAKQNKRGPPTATWRDGRSEMGLSADERHSGISGLTTDGTSIDGTLFQFSELPELSPGRGSGIFSNFPPAPPHPRSPIQKKSHLVMSGIQPSLQNEGMGSIPILSSAFLLMSSLRDARGPIFSVPFHSIYLFLICAEASP